jgi:hypothetical protein
MSTVEPHIRINTIVRGIYRQALMHAKYKENTSYNYPLLDDFMKLNAGALVAELKQLLPTCEVVHTLLAPGTDGRLYDVAKITDDVLPLVDTVIKDSYIVVDWS